MSLPAARTASPTLREKTRTLLVSSWQKVKNNQLDSTEEVCKV